MQFYSDYSSEEDRDDEEVDIWNPNDIIDEILSVEDEEEKLKLKKALIRKFLDQDRPFLTSKMKEFFLEDGVTESLIGFVNRLDENQPQADNAKEANSNEKKQEVSEKSTPAQATPIKKKSNKPRNLNPPGHEEDVRRSFNVMEIFVNPMHDLDHFLSEKLDTILNELFKVFLPNSSGNFHHFNKILEQLIIRSPSAATKVLLGENLLWQMLDWVSETPIVDTLIETFCISFPRQSDTIKFYKSLVDSKMFERIGEKLYGTDAPNPFGVSEFFTKLIEKLSYIEMSGMLFISLCRTSAFIDGLFTVIESEDNKYPYDQKQACASVLRELMLKSGQKVFEQADFTKPLPNMLSAVHDKLHDYSKVHVPQLCNVLISLDGKRANENSIEYSTYTIKRPFGTYRLNLCEVLADSVVYAPEVLDKFPAGVWRVLTSWFLEYRFNNLYHFQFWKIYQTAVRENHLESLKSMFNKYKFLTKMIEQYKSPELSGTRGFIIVMCNTLRFAAELQPLTGFLRHYMISHDGWKAFVITLRTDTQVQIKRYEDVIYAPEGEDEDEDEGGIDLGSAYARSLGFDEAPPAPEESPKTPIKKKKKKPKKKKSMTNLVAESSTAPQGKAESPLHVEEGSNPEVKKEDIDWWNSMVDDFKKEDEKKEEPNSADWWNELKTELQHIESPEKSAAKKAQK